jgi:hypothetical protein
MAFVFATSAGRDWLKEATGRRKAKTTSKHCFISYPLFRQRVGTISGFALDHAVRHKRNLRPRGEREEESGESQGEEQGKREAQNFSHQ